MGLFDIKVKSQRLANIISIRSPEAFRQSIRKIKQDGVTLAEKRSLILAQNRVRAQLKRKALSMKERIAFLKIAKMKLPNIKK